MSDDDPQKRTERFCEREGAPAEPCAGFVKKVTQTKSDEGVSGKPRDEFQIDECLRAKSRSVS